MADVKEEIVDQDLEAQEEAQANDNGKMSSKNSDISIEEIGQEEVDIAKAENAEVSLPEEVARQLRVSTLGISKIIKRVNR